jgi:hypothetical protein
MACNKVDFPLPTSPIIHMNSPFFIFKFISFKFIGILFIIGISLPEEVIIISSTISLLFEFTFIVINILNKIFLYFFSFYY